MRNAKLGNHLKVFLHYPLRIVVCLSSRISYHLSRVYCLKRVIPNPHFFTSLSETIILKEKISSINLYLPQWDEDLGNSESLNLVRVKLLPKVIFVKMVKVYLAVRLDYLFIRSLDETVQSYRDFLTLNRPREK